MMAIAAFLLALPSLATTATVPGVETFHHPGVYHFRGRTVCSLAGLGKRGDHASNRLALDDGRSTVTVDHRRGRITIVNRTSYPKKSTVAEMTLLGSAAGADGGLVPLAVHVRVEKMNSDTSVDIHPHWMVRGKVTHPDIEPFQVVVSDGVSEKLVASDADLLRAATDTTPPYALAGFPVDIKDDLEGFGPSLAPNSALAALSMGIGGKKVRVELRSLEAGNAALAGQPVPALLASGGWELRLTAEPSLLSQPSLGRELLVGLDQVPLVAARIKNGPDNGDTLAFMFRAGKGRVSWGKTEANVPAVLDVVRSFMEFNVLGTALARQVGLATAALGKGQPAARKQ